MTCNEGQKVIHIVGEEGLSHDSERAERNGGQDGKSSRRNSRLCQPSRDRTNACDKCVVLGWLRRSRRGKEKAPLA